MASGLGPIRLPNVHVDDTGDLERAGQWGRIAAGLDQSKLGPGWTSQAQCVSDGSISVG